MAEKVDIERIMRGSQAEVVKLGEISNQTLTRRRISGYWGRLIDGFSPSWHSPTSSNSWTSPPGLHRHHGPPDGPASHGREGYSWSSGIYYFGYLVASYPAAMLMVRWKVGKVITMSVLVWGAVLMLTATAFNAGSLLANRFFLGVTEATIAPGLTIVSVHVGTSATSSLSATRRGSGQHLRRHLGRPCRVRHRPRTEHQALEGRVSHLWRRDGRAASKTEKRAVLRVKENMTGIKSDKIKWGQVKEALLDAKTWLIVALQLVSCIPNGA
ncbi:hypothetical protein J3458_020923 [Metarhizium acridum]|uniref:uncharacterized protein n=1 Tax=Metarhizium acridum TaxID=92637 RepID=UPI001C6CC4AA|nr:hypothetical protein J3458_020923 [Metarhizium acridum]